MCALMETSRMSTHMPNIFRNFPEFSWFSEFWNEPRNIMANYGKYSPNVNMQNPAKNQNMGYLLKCWENSEIMAFEMRQLIWALIWALIWVVSSRALKWAHAHMCYLICPQYEQLDTWALMSAHFMEIHEHRISLIAGRKINNAYERSAHLGNPWAPNVLTLYFQNTSVLWESRTVRN